ncbi:MAG: hypothetical protein OES59_00825, partial [Gammaproteobacteria bacterium]|nr:hypothetical protein [Gammaproteobacteria bacterium]
PALDPPEVDGLNVYADQPELTRTQEAGGLRGVRRDQYAIIGLAGGEVELPALEVPWWDIEAAEWRVARLPARTLIIEGAPVAPISQPEPAVVSAAVDGAETAVQDSEEALAVISTWQRATEVLAILWLLTLAAWWWSSRSAPRRSREPREPEPPPAHKQQGQLLKTARKAAAAGDGAAVRKAILEWGRLQWPAAAPRSLGEFANRVEPPLSDELRQLSAASYSKDGGNWDGNALTSALRNITTVTSRDEAAADDPLPPLMPPAA